MDVAMKFPQRYADNLLPELVNAAYSKLHHENIVRLWQFGSITTVSISVPLFVHTLTCQPSCLMRRPASRCPKFGDNQPVTVLAYELANMGSFHRYWEQHPDLGIDKVLPALLGVATGTGLMPMPSPYVTA